VNEDRILSAESSLKLMLGVSTLAGKTFLDIGSGSGLFSLAARRMGAKVHSFDYDPNSVGCTAELRRRFFDSDPDWTVEEASVLDTEYLNRLGTFDVAYSWGVLHHTGSMWKALDSAGALVKDGGLLFIAIYNRQRFATKYWSFVKKTYNLHVVTRPLFICIHAIYPTIPRIILRTIKRKNLRRGMSIWRDLIDWLGGYPFEVAAPEEIFDFYRARGFALERMKTVGGAQGCNEFVFKNTK
jgi:2-polyprenyl-6-hydroxyphenyl methylase/3-demethylubiquinone-9 3-methyltransferase